MLMAEKAYRLVKLLERRVLDLEGDMCMVRSNKTDMTNLQIENEALREERDLLLEKLDDKSIVNQEHDAVSCNVVGCAVCHAVVGLEGPIKPGGST